MEVTVKKIIYFQAPNYAYESLNVTIITTFDVITVIQHCDQRKFSKKFKRDDDLFNRLRKEHKPAFIMNNTKCLWILP